MSKLVSAAIVYVLLFGLSACRIMTVEERDAYRAQQAAAQQAEPAFHAYQESSKADVTAGRLTWAQRSLEMRRLFFQIPTQYGQPTWMHEMWSFHLLAWTAVDEGRITPAQAEYLINQQHNALQRGALQDAARLLQALPPPQSKPRQPTVPPIRVPDTYNTNCTTDRFGNTQCTTTKW